MGTVNRILVRMEMGTNVCLEEPSPLKFDLLRAVR